MHLQRNVSYKGSIRNRAGINLLHSWVIQKDWENLITKQAAAAITDASESKMRLFWANITVKIAGILESKSFLLDCVKLGG